MLFHAKQMHHAMKTIQSNNHQLGSYELNKVSLSCFDNKRYKFTRGWQKFIRLWPLQNPTVNELHTKQNFTQKISQL